MEPMDELLNRIGEDVIGRVTGPMSFRLVLQPAIATFLAIKAGLQDAREGRAAYFWALVHDAAHRRQLLQDGWKSIAKVFVIALVLDSVYQYSRGPVDLSGRGAACGLRACCCSVSVGSWSGQLLRAHAWSACAPGATAMTTSEAATVRLPEQ